jgi:hypothetical protein
MPSFGFLKSFRKFLGGGLKRRPIRARTARTRLAVECLEDRTLLSTIMWGNLLGGNWDTASNWVGGNLPGPGDAVVIPVLNSGASVTHSTGSDTVQSVTSSANVTLSGGTLTDSGNFQLSSGMSIALNGGTLVNAAVTGTGSVLSASGGTLDGVTINGNLSISGQLTVKDGLTLNGTATIANGFNGLYFVGSQTFGGRGTVVFGNFAPYGSSYVGYNYLYTDSGSSTFTIGAGITISGKSGVVGGFYYTYFPSPQLAGGPIIDQGTVQADVSGGTVYLPGNYQDGTYGSANGGQLLLEGNMTGATVSSGATLTTSGGTLDGVTINGNLPISGQLTVKDGLTLNGTATIADGFNGLYFVGSQTLGGIGTVVFGNTATPYYTTYNYLHTDAATSTLTIGAGITISGNSGVVGGFYYTSLQSPQVSGGPIIDQGTVQADVSGGTIYVVAPSFTSAGTLRAITGGTISLLGAVANTGSTMTLDGSGGTISLSNTITGGTVQMTNGAVLSGNNDTLDGVTVNGNLSVSGQLTVKDGLTLNGTATIADGFNGLVFVGSQTLGGNGTVVFGNFAPYGSSYVGYNYLYTDAGSSTLTIGAGITVHGKYGVVGGFYYTFFPSPQVSGGPIIDQGTLQADVSGGTVYLPGNYQDGTYGSANGGQLLLEGTLLGATVPSGATLTTNGGTLDGVTIDGNLSVSGQLTVKDGLTLNGTATIADGFNGLYFVGSQTLGGSGTVVFGNSTPYGSSYISYNYLYTDAATSTLTIGAGLTIRGKYGVLGGFYYTYYSSPQVRGGPVIDQGTVQADVSGGTIYLPSYYQGGIFGSANGGQLLLEGTLTGATVRSGTTLTTSGGALDGVDVEGNISVSGTLTVKDGLTLDGTATIASGFNGLYFVGSQTLQGSGTVVFGNSVFNGATFYNYLYTDASGSTLTIGPGLTVRGNYGVLGGVYVNSYSVSGGPIVNQGTVQADVSGGTIAIVATSFNSDGILCATNGGTLSVRGPYSFGTGAEALGGSGGNITFSGTYASTGAGVALLGGGFTFTNAGTAAAPILLEAPSRDNGANSDAFNNNFALDSLVVTGNSHVRLVDDLHTIAGTGAEAFYFNALELDAGSSLDLNGLNVYTRTSVVNGTLIGGAINTLPNAGSIDIDSSAPGTISVAGQLAEWTFFARGGQSVTVLVNPGSSGSPAPLSPTVGYINVQLLDTNGNVLESGSSANSGGIVVLPAIALPTDGTYKVYIQAATGHAGNTGNYVLGVWNSTVSVATTVLNQNTYGQLASPYASDQWTFSAAANTQIQFNLLATSADGLNFSLTGPTNYYGFSNITGSSSLVSLPTAGTYTLTAQGTGGATGSFSFELAQSAQTPLALNTPYNGTFAGSGQALLFTVNVPAVASMDLQLADNAASDHTELYARLGTPPTREDYTYGANGAGASQSLLIPSASAGTWYVLVYAESVAAPPSSFTLRADTSSVLVTAVTPVAYSTNSVASLTLTGAGFTTATAVALVAANGITMYPASNVAFDTFTQLTATINLAGVPQGSYSVRVTNADGGSDTLPGAFTVTAAGQANLQTQLILPASVGRHIAATFYVKYSNTGTAAMPAPVLLLES